ncbi:MAG: DUF2306 domain-containing protein [Acidobacteriota bacterium]|nr:DUF2306 domain-containing protein [Acidobacteriota bacterium]
MIFSGSIGLIHLTVSIFALVFGTWVLAARKGTRAHRRIGYAYAVSMILLIATAFMIYRLFGRFGIFHIAAIASTITLLGGMIPVIRRRPKNSWLNLHFNFMYWSVFGLYAAFVAEMAVRLPFRAAFSSPTTFFITVGVATFSTMMVGQIIFLKNKKKWQTILTVPTENENLLSD